MMGRPKVYPLRKIINFRVTPEVVEVLQKAAAARGMKQAQLLRLLLMRIVNDNLFSAVLDDE